MNFAILFSVFLLSIVQVVYAQDLSETLSGAINNEIQDTFESATSNLDNTNNTISENNNGTDSTNTNTNTNTNTTTTTTTFGPGNSNSTSTTMKTNIEN